MKQMFRTILGIGAIVAGFSTTLQAAPSLGETVTVTQPDGEKITVVVIGDEYYRRVESPEGHTLIKTEDGTIEYAILNEDSTGFIGSGIRYPLPGKAVSTQSTSPGVEDTAKLPPKGLKLKAKAIQEKVQKARLRLHGQDQSFNSGAAPSVLQSSTANSAADTYTAAAGRGSFGNLDIDSVTGLIVGLTILIDFPDDTATIPVSEVERYLNEPGYTGFNNNGSIRDYWYDVSNGKVEYINEVTQYLRAPRTKTYYNDTVNSARPLVDWAIKRLDTLGYDFSNLTGSDYDTASTILAINFYYAGNRNTSWSNGLWPHRSSHYVVLSDGRSTSGYQITDMRSSLSIGTFVHETGHLVFHWPDLYDYGYDSKGIGQYCLMGFGSSPGTNPIPPNPYFRAIRGWEELTSLNPVATPVVATDLHGDFHSYVYENIFDLDEFFFISNDMQSGRWQSFPDEGLAIWHIDEGGSNNCQDMTLDCHYRVSIEQADGLFELETDVNYGGPDDLFHAGNASEFTDATLPDALWWDSRASGLHISNISEQDSSMQFTVWTQPYSSRLSGEIAFEGNVHNAGYLTFAQARSSYLKIINSSVTESLTVADIRSDHEALTLPYFDAFIIPPNSFRSEYVRFEPSARGFYHGAFTVVSTARNDTAKTLPWYGTFAYNFHIADSIIKISVQNQQVPVSTPIRVFNYSDTVISWQLSANQTPWITVEQPQGHIAANSSQSILVSIVPQGLAQGFYTADLLFTHDAATPESPYIIDVELHVDPDAQNSSTITRVGVGATPVSKSKSLVIRDLVIGAPVQGEVEGEHFTVIYK